MTMFRAQGSRLFPADAIGNFALRLVRTSSLSGEESAIATVIATEMRALGLGVRVDEWGNVLGSIDAGPGPCVLFDAHMDTVGVNRAAWTQDPSGQIVADRLFGRGATDMKGPLAAAVYGIAGIGDELKRGQVVVAATVCEELVEGPVLEHIAQAMHPRYVVICEATALKLARGQRGRAEVVLRVAGRATHSSRPEFGINAGEAMADIIVALRDIPLPRHEVAGAGVLALTDVKSDPYPGRSVIPDGCVATFDRRTLPGEAEAEVLAPIRTVARRAAARTGAHVTVEIAKDDFRTYTGQRVVASNFAPAWVCDEGAEIVTRAAAALESVGLPPTLSCYSFCTNGSGTAGRLGIPTVGFGPGDESLAHRADEFIRVEDLVLAARGYAALACYLTESGS